MFLYFSAHWCPPCRKFTPMLAEWYNMMKKGGAKVEIIFMSCDKSKEESTSYFKDMPWKRDTFPASCGGDTFGLKGIPALVLMNEDGTAAATDGRKLVGELVMKKP